MFILNVKNPAVFEHLPFICYVFSIFTKLNVLLYNKSLFSTIDLILRFTIKNFRNLSLLMALPFHPYLHLLFGYTS